MQIDFDGRYGEQNGNEYICYCFKNIDTAKLKKLVCESSPIAHPWGEAILVRHEERSKKQLIILGAEQGYFISSLDEDLISCWDKNKLTKIVCPDDIEIPLGSIMPVEAAWNVIMKFVDTGKLSENIQWISWGDIPEDANWTYDK